MFGLFKKKDRQVTEEDLEVVAEVLKQMAYDLTPHGKHIAALVLKKGNGHVNAALFIALSTMASDVKAVGLEFLALTSFHAHVMELLPILKIYKDKGMIGDDTWKYYATAFNGVSTVDSHQEAWIERILGGNEAAKEQMAISRVAKAQQE